MSENFLQNASEAELTFSNQILRYYENLVFKWHKSFEIQTKTQKKIFQMNQISLCLWF